MLLIGSLSRVSTYFSKVDALPWTSYLDECLQILDQNTGVAGDRLLAQLARLQLIDNKVAQTPGIERLCERASPTKSRNSTVTPWTFYLRALQVDLRASREAIPSEVQENSELPLS